MAASWNPSRTAPASTASRVKRYAVPMRTPTVAPRSARGAATAATMAADRSSWSPPAPRDQRERGPHRPDRFELRLPQFGGNEAEDADAPLLPGELLRRLPDQGCHLCAAHEGQGQERQTSLGSDRTREGDAVTHPRHGSLGDGQGRAAVRGEQVLADGRPDGLDD